MEATLAAALQKMPIFGGLRADILDLLLTHASRVAKSEGEYFFRRDEPAESLYVIAAGRVAIVREWQGTVHKLSELGPGDCFGEMALMDFTPRSASVLALVDTAALEIPVSAIQALSEKDLEQFALIQMNLGREVSRRLRRADEALFRLRMGERAGEGEDGKGPLT